MVVVVVVVLVVGFVVYLVIVGIENLLVVDVHVWVCWSWIVLEIDYLVVRYLVD